LCHICSEIRDLYKKTGAWFYKGLPHYELSKNRLSSVESVQLKEQLAPKKSPKTTKLGMEIDSDEEEDDDDETEKETPKDEGKIVKNGSFSSGFLRNRNLFNLRLTTDTSSSRLTIDSNSTLTKKSPITPYTPNSRQTSSSDSQKSAHSFQPQMLSDWECASANSNRRRNSASSCYSYSESVGGNECLSLNQSE
jgi:hypothetical protein